MATSKHLAVRDAILALFAGLAGGNVQRGRGWPMAAQDDQLIKVYLDTSTVQRIQMQGQPDDWATRVRCECQARGTSTVNGEDRADALATAAYALVLVDPFLGGLCIDCVPVGMAWAIEEADTSIGVVQLVFEASHRTPFNSIAA